MADGVISSISGENGLANIWSIDPFASGTITTNVDLGTNSDQCSAVGWAHEEMNKATIRDKNVSLFLRATVNRIISLLGMGYYHSLIVLWQICSTFTCTKVKTFQ